MKKPPESVHGAYSAVPHRVLDSNAFIGASDHAKSLLFALIRQHNGSNNGRFQLTNKWLAKRGWASISKNVKARNELIERSLVVCTRLGGRNMGASWFALTWLPITNFVGLDIKPSEYHQGAWDDCKLKPTARRKPPQKRNMHSDSQNSAVPVTGIDECSAVPVVGTKEVFSDTSTVPVVGNDVLLPLSPVNLFQRKKRIVGKVGRSGIPKELHR